MPLPKRSLLDLLPPPTQRDPKRSAVATRHAASDDKSKPKTDAVSEKHSDNEQYRVQKSSALEQSHPVSLDETATEDTLTVVHETEALIQQTMEDEECQRKKGQRKSTEIEFKEISQDALKDGISCVQREVDAIGLALKADEGEEEKVVMPEYTLSKEAKRKHQITTLFQTMKQNETKLLTKEAQNARTKRETASYGMFPLLSSTR